MYQKGCHCGNEWKQVSGHSSSSVPVLPHQGGLDLRHQNVRNQGGFSRDWREPYQISILRNLMRSKILAIVSCGISSDKLQKTSVIATILEDRLFTDAASQEEYLNHETLIERLQSHVDRLNGYIMRVLHANGSQVDNILQTLAHLGVHGTITTPDGSASTLGTSSHFPQQHAHDSMLLKTDQMKYTDSSATIHINESQPSLTKMGQSPQSEAFNLLIPQHVSKEIPQVSNIFPSTSSSLERPNIGDLRQHGTPMFGSEQNCDPFVQPNELCGTTNSMVPPTSCFVDQGEHGCQMIGHNTREQPQIIPRLINLDEQFHSEHLGGLVDSMNSKMMDSIVRGNDDPSGYSEAMPLRPIKRLKVDPAFGVSVINNASSDVGTQTMVQPYPSEVVSDTQLDSHVVECNVEKFIDAKLDSMSIDEMRNILKDYACGQTFENETVNAVECNVEQFRDAKLDCVSIDEMNNIVRDDACGQTLESENVPSAGLLLYDHIAEQSNPKGDDVIASKNLEEDITNLNSNEHAPRRDPITAETVDKQGRTEFNQAEINATKEVIELKTDQAEEIKASNDIVNGVSIIEFFTSTQIKEHIKSLGTQVVQSSMEEANMCQLCARQNLHFAPVPMYCVCCSNRIKQNANYYHKKGEEFVTQNCFCTSCYRNSQGGCIKYNGVSVSKSFLVKQKNDEVFEESWVQCDKCKGWQHQICGLYNNERDLDNMAEYTCPICCLKEIENGKRVPLPMTANFGAKDLPSTMLSNHIEKRLFKRLRQENADWIKGKGSDNVDEVFEPENLSVKVVLSVDKYLKVKKEFLDIFLEDNYPAEFPYKSKVILLFQKIEGVDVCLFGMYVQEFGSECGNPNQRSVYISYLDSVKYFRPERVTVTGEALRTIIYHEILIGYLDFCKKQGFTTCYIWACPPIKGEDYVLYCHPDTQKTPKNDKLRRWYHSMLAKASKENIVVGLTNIYDNFFVTNGKRDSKVTTARLPYFDGDYWCGAAMDFARNIERECGGEYEKKLKELLSKRTLKSMGHVNPSKGVAKDILVMQQLGQTILPVKEDFIIAHLQYSCMHCDGMIVSGKRWFCIECKKFQECERCHTADSHTSVDGEKHTLSQALVDDTVSDTRENDIIPYYGLFESRHNFLSFCQKNHFQFDTLRRAKYSSMMILCHLRDHSLVTNGTTMCSMCGKHESFQQSLKCEICPEFTVCSACYKERGPDCHAHKLTQTSSKALSARQSRVEAEISNGAENAGCFTACF